MKATEARKVTNSNIRKNEEFTKIQGKITKACNSGQSGIIIQDMISRQTRDCLKEDGYNIVDRGDLSILISW